MSDSVLESIADWLQEGNPQLSVRKDVMHVVIRLVGYRSNGRVVCLVMDRMGSYINLYSIYSTPGGYVDVTIDPADPKSLLTLQGAIELWVRQVIDHHRLFVGK